MRVERVRRSLLLAAALAAALAAVTALGGCNRSEPAAAPFNNVDLTGAKYAQGFKLTDHAGVVRTLADFKGKVTVIFFGFTHCPDACPTTMVELAEVRKRLGADGERLQVLFVTLDPERDSADALSKYVPAFDPSFLGLYGTAEQTAEVAREFKVFYQKVPGQTPLSYTLDHTAGSYVFDKEGRIRLLIRPNQPIEAVVADIRRLI
jgi:protein SCO1/2